MESLLQIYEIPKLAGLRETFPHCELRDIEVIEYKMFKDYLGLDFRRDLMEKLATYTNVQEYEDSKAYVANDLVYFQRYIYKAVGSTTGNRPDNIAYWISAPKFEEPLYEKLWCKYLGPYLAYHMVKHVVAPSSIHLGPQGAARRSGDNFQAASTSEMNLLIGSIESKIAMTIDVMVDWMKYEKETNKITLFDNYLGFKNGCSGTDGVGVAASKHRFRIA